MNITIFNKTGGKNRNTIMSSGLQAFIHNNNLNNNKIILTNEMGKVNSDICIMLSFFNKFKNLNGVAKFRQIIYNNNKDKKWIF